MSSAVFELEKTLESLTLSDQFNGPVYNVYDLDHFTAICDDLIRVYPANTLHAIACKAIGLTSVLRIAQQRGLGCECASYGEVNHALRIGFEAHKIVYDSPVKTLEEIRMALSRGVSLNVDNWEELDKVASVIQQLGSSFPVSERQFVGLRVNPCLEDTRDTISVTSTASSKFGVAVTEMDAILAAFAKHEFLNALHCHSGSQHCPLEHLARGTQVLCDVFQRVEDSGKQIRYLDIGGGLPIVYGGDTKSLQVFQDHMKRIQSVLPDSVTLVTEFGRIFAPSGFTVSRVEAVKICGGAKVALIHFGADHALRQVFTNYYDCKYTCHSPDGALKEAAADQSQYVYLGGPLCFSGDVLKQQKEAAPLPDTVCGGDWVVMHDTASYTMCMWSRYNSRTVFPTLGFRRGAAGDYQWSVLRQGETYDEVSRFWGE